MKNKIINGDCLKVMKDIPDKSVDMILADLPYGTTACKWDSVIPLDKLWEQYERIIKDNGAIVLTASQPFTTALISSNMKLFRYEWIWEKTRANGYPMSKYRPLKQHENICIFSKSPATFVKGKESTTYNPQGLQEINKTVKGNKNRNYTTNSGGKMTKDNYTQKYTNYPKSILEFSNTNRKDSLHPTQKPVELFEYLIKTYTNEGDTVLDNTAGVMTTAIAAINTNRNYICIEKDEDYYNTGLQRVEEHLKKKGECINV